MPGSPLDLFTGKALAAGQWTGQAICGFTGSLADGVAHQTTGSIAETVPELLDIFLVGCGDF
jgi:hypothetical protein